MNGVVHFALQLANMPAETIADLEKALPGMDRLAALAKVAEPDLKLLQPIIEKMAPLVSQLEPLVADATPIALRLLPQIKLALPDVQAITPTIQELIAFAEGKKAS